MTTDRLFGGAKGPWAWTMCGIVLALAVVSVVEWFRWGGIVFIIGAVALGVLSVTGMVRLRRLSNENNERTH